MTVQNRNAEVHGALGAMVNEMLPSEQETFRQAGFAAVVAALTQPDEVQAARPRGAEAGQMAELTPVFLVFLNVAVGVAKEIRKRQLAQEAIEPNLRQGLAKRKVEQSVAEKIVLGHGIPVVSAILAYYNHHQ